MSRVILGCVLGVACGVAPAVAKSVAKGVAEGVVGGTGRWSASLSIEGLRTLLRVDKSYLGWNRECDGAVPGGCESSVVVVSAPRVSVSALRLGGPWGVAW